VPVSAQGVHDLGELLRPQVLQVAHLQALDPVLGITGPAAPRRCATCSAACRPKSPQRRFLHVVNQLDDPMIQLLAGGVDGVHHIALLLVVLPPEGKEEPAGVAHLLQYPDVRPPPTSPSPSSTTGKDAAPA